MQALFLTNTTIEEWPIKVVYRLHPFDPAHYPAKVAFAVSKRYFPKAHDRNTLKRNLREGYRVNKTELYDALKATDQQLLLIFIYTGKKLASFADLQPKIILILKRLTKVIENPD